MGIGINSKLITMKKLTSIILAGLLAFVSFSQAENIESNPGYLDFSEYLTVSIDDSVTEVNLKGPLLKIAASLAKFESQEAYEVLSGIKLVRVHVFEVTDSNRDEFDASVAGIADTLTNKNWDELIKVKDGDETVSVFARMRDEDAFTGLVVSVRSGDEAVFVNIVGEVELEALANLGDHLDVPGLDVLKNLKDHG